MTSTAVTAPDFSGDAFRRRVADHITQTFGSLLPEDQFRALVDAQVKFFFDTPREFTFKTEDIIDKSRGYNDKIGTRLLLNTKITPFQQMVWELVKEHVSERLKQYFADGGNSEIEKYLNQWTALKEFKDHQIADVNKLALAMVARAFADQFNLGVNTVRNEMALKFQAAGMPDVSNFLYSNPIQGV